MDHQEFTDWVMRLERQMLAIAVKVTRNRHLAEEVVQQALLLAWRAREKGKSHPKPDALLMKITKRAALTLWRKEHRQRFLSDLLGEVQMAASSETAGTEPGRSNVLDALWRCFRALSEKERGILNFHYRGLILSLTNDADIDKQTAKDIIAEIRAMSAPAINVAVFRAITKLRDCMKCKGYLS